MIESNCNLLLRHFFQLGSYTLSGVAIFSLLLLSSCKKEDLSSVDLKEQVTTALDFFTIPPGTDPTIARVINELKKMKVPANYWENFSINNGRPLWNKVIKTVNDNATSFTSNGKGGDSLYYIPLILADEFKVNGFITTRLDNNVSISYSLAQDYVAYSYSRNNTVSPVANFSTKLALLNNIAFGYKDFEVNDDKLFTNDTLESHTEGITIDTITQSLLHTSCATYTSHLYICDHGTSKSNITPCAACVGA